MHTHDSTINYEQKLLINNRKSNILKDHMCYLKNHVTLKDVLFDFTQAICTEKPDDLFAYTQQYFKKQKRTNKAINKKHLKQIEKKKKRQKRDKENRQPNQNQLIITDENNKSRNNKNQLAVQNMKKKEGLTLVDTNRSRKRASIPTPIKIEFFSPPMGRTIDALLSEDPMKHHNAWTKDLDHVKQEKINSSMTSPIRNQSDNTLTKIHGLHSNTLLEYHFDRLTSTTIPNILMKEARKTIIRRYKHIFGFSAFGEDTTEGTQQPESIVDHYGPMDDATLDFSKSTLKHRYNIQLLCFILDLVLEWANVSPFFSCTTDTILHDVFVIETILHAKHIRMGNITPFDYINMLVAMMCKNLGCIPGILTQDSHDKLAVSCTNTDNVNFISIKDGISLSSSQCHWRSCEFVKQRLTKIDQDLMAGLSPQLFDRQDTIPLQPILDIQLILSHMNAFFIPFETFSDFQFQDSFNSLIMLSCLLSSPHISQRISSIYLDFIRSTQVDKKSFHDGFKLWLCDHLNTDQLLFCKWSEDGKSLLHSLQINMI